MLNYTLSMYYGNWKHTLKLKQVLSNSPITDPYTHYCDPLCEKQPYSMGE